MSATVEMPIWVLLVLMVLAWLAVWVTAWVAMRLVRETGFIQGRERAMRQLARAAEREEEREREQPEHPSNAGSVIP